MADLEENARRHAAGKRTITLSPIAIEVVRRIDALFDIERSINGKPAEGRRAVRQELSKPLVEAEEIMGKYDVELPFVRLLGRKCEELAQTRGYIKLLDGARCHFDLWEASWLSKDERSRGYAWNFRMAPCSLEEARERQRQTIGEHAHPWKTARLKRAFTHKAMNRRIQGNAARQTKMAMASCWEEGLVPMLQMHDELCFSLTSPEAGDRIAEIMRSVYTCSVPFLVDQEWGVTWGGAKHDHGAALALLGAKAGPLPKGRKAAPPTPLRTSSARSGRATAAKAPGAGRGAAGRPARR